MLHASTPPVPESKAAITESNIVFIHSKAGVVDLQEPQTQHLGVSVTATHARSQSEAAQPAAAIDHKAHSTGSPGGALEGPATPPTDDQQVPTTPDVQPTPRRKGLKSWLSRKSASRASHDATAAATNTGAQPSGTPGNENSSHNTQHLAADANDTSTSQHSRQSSSTGGMPRNTTGTSSSKSLTGKLRKALSRPAQRTDSQTEAGSAGAQPPLGPLHIPSRSADDFPGGPIADSTSDFGGGAPETPNSQTGGPSAGAQESSPFSSQGTAASQAVQGPSGGSKGSQGSLVANLPGPAFGSSSSKAWQEKYLASVGQGAPGDQGPCMSGLAGRWRKNLDESATGAVVEELLDMPKLQRMARQRTHVLEIEETQQELKLVWHVRLNGGREILKIDKYQKDGSIVEAPRKDGRDGQQRSFLNYTQGHLNIRGVQGDPHGALFQDRYSLSSRGNRLKIDHKLQLLLHGVAPVKYTTIWNRMKDDEQTGSGNVDDLLSSQGVDSIVRR